MADFVGRGEKVVLTVLQRLFLSSEAWTQFPIVDLVSKENAEQYGEEFSQHKCDIVIKVKNSKDSIETLAVEVNYKHKEKAAKKWSNTFAPDLLNNNKIPVTVDDYDCRKKGVFHLNSKKEHVLSWNDFRDVIDQLEKAGVEP